MLQFVSIIVCQFSSGIQRGLKIDLFSEITLIVPKKGAIGLSLETSNLHLLTFFSYTQQTLSSCQKMLQFTVQRVSTTKIYFTMLKQVTETILDLYTSRITLYFTLSVTATILFGVTRFLNHLDLTIETGQQLAKIQLKKVAYELFNTAKKK